MIPDSWMPPAAMKRIIIHWTAGAYVASSLDREHYHFLVDGEGKLVRGHPSVADNVPPLKEGVYAAHTKGTNSHSIGIAVCAMHEATDSPFNAGKFPIKKVQIDSLIEAVADLCRRYKIPVTRSTVLSHAEVQPTLGIKQNGKWDIARLPYDLTIKGPLPVGDHLRKLIAARL